MRRCVSVCVLAVLALGGCSSSPAVELPVSHEDQTGATTAAPVPTTPPRANHLRAHRVRGTVGDDVLVGTRGRDIIDGQRGTDVIRGRAGDDELSDSSGVGTGRPLDTTRDTFYGGPGDDLIYSSKHDRVHAGPGDDTVYANYLEPGDGLACGTGRDLVVLNDDDPGLVLTGCETVRVQYAG
jgi:Ca2+-binding RTX toxin-like protein